MEAFCAVLGKVVMVLGGCGAVAALALVVLEAGFRVYRRGRNFPRIVEAVKDWNARHPDEKIVKSN
jgi:hypothetical protein